MIALTIVNCIIEFTLHSFFLALFTLALPTDSGKFHNNTIMMQAPVDGTTHVTAFNLMHIPAHLIYVEFFGNI